MASISESYASPGLRWGLLLEDHPQATYEFSIDVAETFGVPPDFGGDALVCVATIIFPDRPNVVAWKAPGPEGKGHGQDQRTPDGWNILQTKTLGRALKRAGYPDDMPSLKALMLWRKRNAEVSSIVEPHVIETSEARALTTGDDDDDTVLDAAAVESPDHASPDDSGAASVDGDFDDTIYDAEV